MRETTGRRSSWKAGIAALVLAAASYPALARNGAGLAIRGVVARSGALSVTVTNGTDEARRGTVIARVMTLRGVVEVVTSVDVPPKGTAILHVKVPGSGAGDLPLGVVIDDGVPF
jgi:hypothetical protein